MNDGNPLSKQLSLDDLAKQYTTKCLSPGANIYNTILHACFQSKAQGIDECIHLIDSMINADNSQMSKNERNVMLRTLHNLRTSYAYQRELIIRTYDK